MGSLVGDNALNCLTNQISGGSRSSILLSRVDFKTVEDEDDLMSAKTLQTKYNVLISDNKISLNNNSNNELTVKLNGQTKCLMNSAINNIVTNINGNSDCADGVPVPKTILFPRERVSLEWKECRTIGAGLINMGNTCFLNSVLQCLSYCPPLVNYLLHSNDHNVNKCNTNANVFCTVCEMARHVRQVRSSSGQPVRPLNICRRLKSIAKHLQFGRQEDAHEFLRYLIDHMWKSCLNNSDFTHQKLDPLSKETTAINQIFGGYHRSQVICFQCKNRSNTYDYFMDFMLDIKNVNSLEKALEKFTQPEILQNDDSYKCTRCKKKVAAKKQFTVFKAPNVATFQFKRFDYNRMFGGKITKHISYPEKLNLRPYMSENKGSPIMYRLNSVLVHLGPTCNSGHYFCYVRNSNNGWYLMDDSRVIQSNLEHALNQGQAYVLFYVRVDTDFHKPTPIKNFISQTTPNGIKLSSISSPELAIRHQKLNSMDSTSKLIGPTQLIVRKPTSTPDIIKNNASDSCKQNDSSDRKLNNSDKNVKQPKGLVPYTTDSSDEDSPKPTNQSHNNHINGSLNTNCDNSHKKDIFKQENNSNENNSHKESKTLNVLPKVRLNSNQNIPSPKPKPENQINSTPNNTSDSSSCPPLAPITLKVKATTSSWQVVETALWSPSIASNSSTNSVNSTTEWTVSECKTDCNGKPSKHQKHKHKKLYATANGCVSQMISTNDNINDKIPQNEKKYDVIKKETDNSNNDISGLNVRNETKTSHKNQFNVSIDVNRNIGSLETQRDSHSRTDHLDAKSISSSSRRSSSDSLKEDKRRNRDSDRSYSRSGNSDDERNTLTGHRHDRHKKKRKRDSTDSSRSDDTRDDRIKVEIKIKHKKKKKKSKKHKKRERSDSDSDDSDHQLQWIERTKETVERERNIDAKPIVVKQWDENVRDLSKKRSFDESNDCQQKSENVNNGKNVEELNNNDSNVVNELMKNNVRNFGEKVNSWNGGPSQVDRSHDDHKYRSDSQDEYDDEFDRGKTKKIKKSHGNDRFYNSSYNKFQKFHTDRNKHKINGSFNSYPMKSHFISNFKDRQNHNKWSEDSHQSRHQTHDKSRRH